MIYRSKAPLRLGLAGGGTDVSPYSELYGGAILNATISLYAHAHIEGNSDQNIFITAADRDEKEVLPLSKSLPLEGAHILAKGIYNRLMSEFNQEPRGFKLTTYVDAPAGSGLGSSSTLMVAILGVFREWMQLPLGEYDIAHMAYEIERHDLAMAGGKQDQYAATFGGVNFMEFYKGDKVIVNPLRIKSDYLRELENNLLLFYTSTSRLSSAIIEAQKENVIANNQISIEAMHSLKQQAYEMKEALLRGNIEAIGEILDFGFQNKKKMAEGISNPQLDKIYNVAKLAGASGGKISGAGGGGYMMFYCPGVTRYQVADALKEFGTLQKFNFEKYGMLSWCLGY